MHGLKKLVQSQHQLKTITIEKGAAKMRTIFKILESQSSSLESIILKSFRFHSDDFSIEQIKFHQLERISIKSCIVFNGGLKSIFEADLPKLQQLELKNIDWEHTMTVFYCKISTKPT